LVYCAPIHQLLPSYQSISVSYFDLILVCMKYCEKGTIQQNTTLQTKYWTTRTPLEPGMNSVVWLFSLSCVTVLTQLCDWQVYCSSQHPLLPFASPRAIVGVSGNNKLDITLIPVNKCIIFWSYSSMYEILWSCINK
jgi:hypothetical protein